MLDLKKWLLLAGYLVCVVFLTVIHEPWLDELHAWVMARDMSLPELWSAMKVEGHFCLWFWILMPFAKVGLEVYWLQIISIAFMMIAAGLLVFKTDFSLIAKAAILLSFPMVYQFSVISRCYALIPPILFGIALCYKDLDKNKWLFAVLVGLLAHTHVYMEGMVLALFLLFIYEMILPKYREKRLRMADFWPLFVILLFVLFAFAQVARNPFSPVVYYLGHTEMDGTAKGLAPTVSYLFKGYSILPLGMFEGGMNEIIAYSLAFIPMLILSCIMFFSFDWKDRTILIISIGWQIFVSVFVFSFGHQRTYLPFFIFLTLYIMMGNNTKKTKIVILCLCVLASISGYSHHIRNDISMTYSSFKPLAETIKDKLPKNEPIYTLDFGGDSVKAYLMDSRVEIIPSPLDSSNRNSFYVISNRWNINGYKMDYIYDGSGCFWDKFSLIRLTRIAPQQNKCWNSNN